MRFLLPLAMLAAVQGFALEPSLRVSQYVHDSFTTNDGLPQDSINDITQTPDGYLWVATQEGLARFDGVRFTAFDSRNTRTFTSDFVFTLFADRKGTLWAGASDGLMRYDGRGRFTRFAERHGFNDSAAKYISEDPAGNLWIGFGTGRTTGGKGLVRFRNGQARTFTTKDGLPSDQVYQTTTDRSGALWIGTGRGLAVMRNGAISTYTTKNGLPMDLVRDVHEDRAGTLWLGTSAGLVRFDGKRFTTVLAGEIESIFEDRHGALWIATGKGLHRLMNGKLEAATVEGLAEDRIFGLFEDREGSLWIGTHASGLHRLRAGKFTPWGSDEGLLGDSVHGIYEDAKKRLWMGTAPGGVNVLDGGKVTTYSTGEGFPASNARAFVEDGAGTMWIGTSDGLVRFDGARFRLFDTGDGLPHRSVNTVFEDGKGTLWIGTNGGLARREGERFEAVTAIPQALDEIRVIRQDRQGRLLIAGGDGAGFFDGTQFTPLMDKVNVMAAHEDGDGTLWLATWGDGLLRVRDGAVKRFTAAEGLFDSTIWSIVDDGRGNLWMGSNRGVFRVPRRQLERGEAIVSTVYGRDDGMRRRETNAGSPAAVRTRDGRIWFGTTGGAVVIDPAHIPVNRLPPNVVVERFVANEANVTIDGPLILAPGTRSLEVHYAALSLVTPSRVRYRYLLEGFDDHWIDAGTRRSAYYTNIDPGSYTFRVTAANDDGVWNQAGTSLPIHLRPFFYQTWWFYLAAAAGLVLLFFAIRGARRRAREIRHRMYHDPLTGLPNRALLAERAEVALSQAARRGRSIAILFLDLDGFKGVNDRYGHAAGDDLLRQVADRLRACIREIDTLARIGGDEFAALVAEIDDESRAAEVAQRMIDTLRPTFAIGPNPVTLGISVGIAFHPYDGESIGAILQAADRAMYRAKLAGGNQYQYNAADRDELLTF